MRIQHALTLVGIVLGLGLEASVKADPLDNWHLRNPSSQTGNLAAVAYGGGLFVAVGYETASRRDWILTSPDGMVWTSRSSGTTNQLTDVAYGNETFVALGTQDVIGYPPTTTIVISTNGTVWSKAESFPSNRLAALTYGNGIFVMVGYSQVSGTAAKILTSRTGTSWTSQSVTGIQSTWAGVAFGNGLFAATDTSGATLTSFDGSTWTSGERAPSAHALAYGNGLFLLTYGENAFGATAFFVSPDARNWTSQGFLFGRFYGGLAYGNGIFVATGGSGEIATLNATTMHVDRRNLGSSYLEAATYGRGTFVAVGPGGVILQSDPLPTARLAAGPLGETGLPLTITGEAGVNYRLQAAAELPSSNWTDLLTFTNTAPATNFVDTDATNFNQRIYRVVSP